jgi:maltose-binding protein MalE
VFSLGDYRDNHKANNDSFVVIVCRRQNLLPVNIKEQEIEMKHRIKKVISIGLAIALIGGFTGCGQPVKENQNETLEEAKEEQNEIILWYTNDALSTYIEEAAKEYETNTKIKVTSKLVSPIDYIENINQAVLSNQAAPDLFISENRNLEKLYLAGLTTEIADETFTENQYYETALNAFTYKEKRLGYPLYFETSYLLYNQEYVAAPPGTIDEILAFAEEFDAPKGVQSIFNWDVTDILCNYFFIGNYLNNDEIDNENYFTDRDQLIAALQYYQNLNQYFAIDADTVDYETAFQEFIEGKSVFTIAKTDKLPEIEMIEGEVSEEVQTINQDGNIEKIISTDEEGNAKTEDEEASQEELEKAYDQSNQEDSKNNSENLQSSSEESNHTKLVGENTIVNYRAGVERILSEYFSAKGTNANATDDTNNSNTVEENQNQEPEEEIKPEITTSDEIPNSEESTSATATVVDKNSNFKIAPLPNLTTDLAGKGIAISYGVFVNGYTVNKQEAAEFAKYLTYDKAASLYKKAGKLSSRSGIDYQNENISNILNEYERNVSTPKIMENEDFWLKLEIAFSNIWKGSDVAQIIEEMSK